MAETLALFLVVFLAAFVVGGKVGPRGLGPEHEGCDECDRLWQAVVDAWQATYPPPEEEK